MDYLEGVRFRARLIASLVAAALSPAALLQASPATGGMALCGTPRTVQEALFLRQQRALRAPASGQPGRSRAELPPDVGDIAIIGSSPEIVAPPNPFDLSGKWITVTPGQSGLHVAPPRPAAPGTIESRGLPLKLEDDDFAVVELPFLFRYYGKEYDKAFVHSDGYVTLGRPASRAMPRSYSTASGGPPRIAPLFADLDPSSGGRVRFDPLWHRATLTWHRVPLHSGGGGSEPQTFQLVLRADGAIEFRYGEVDPPGAVVGMFPGDAAGPAEAVDWSAAGRREFGGTSALAEVFTRAAALDEFAVAQAFFRAHEDAYDTLVVFSDVGLGTGRDSLARAYTVRNEVSGIGLDRVDAGQLLGSPRRLSAFVNMGDIAQYPADPLQPLARLPHASTLTLLAHEVGHRFLAYPSFLDPGTGLLSEALLGRQLAHWSFYFNSQASVLEGNAIEDRGAGASPRFVTVAASRRYSPLDQYLMGLRAPAEVSPAFLVTTPDGGHGIALPERMPEVGVGLDGIRKEVLVEDIIAAEGLRRPDTSVAQRQFRQAFALVVPSGETPDPRAVAQLQRLRAAWHGYFAEQLGGRATAASGLVRMLHLSTWPAGGLIAGGRGHARVSIAAPRETDLAVRLTVAEAIASAPLAVTIPAGAVHADFPLEGLEAGTTSLAARATEEGYDSPLTRIAVRSALEGLAIERMHPPELRGVAGQYVPVPLRFRVRDENLVPYSGVTLRYKASGDGAALYVNGATDASGVASLRWRLTQSPSRQAVTASLGGAPQIASVTQATAEAGHPAFEPPGLVNAASLEAPAPGTGFAPGSLLTIRGTDLSAETRSAETFLFSQELSLPFELAGVRVHVGGAPAPLVSVSPRSVTFQLPFEARLPFTDVLVTAPHGRSRAVRIPISPVQPGIYPDRVSTGAHIAGVGAQVFPREKGTRLLELFCTGLGAVDPPGRTGQAGLRDPWQRVRGKTQAWVDEVEREVTYSGLVTFEAGTYSVTLEFPEPLQPGKHTVQIAVDGIRSNLVEFQFE